MYNFFYVYEKRVLFTQRKDLVLTSNFCLLLARYVEVSSPAQYADAQKEGGFRKYTK